MILGAFDDVGEKRDGEACLRKLDRAAALDPRVGGSVLFRQLHARCTMRAGRCDDGTREYPGTQAQAAEWAARECPSSSASSAKNVVRRAAREMLELMPPRDADACRAKFGQIDKRMHEIATDPDAAQARTQGEEALELGVVCVARLQGCQAARPMFELYLGIHSPGADVAREWKRFVAKKKLECR